MQPMQNFRDRKLSLWQSVVEEKVARSLAARSAGGAAATRAAAPTGVNFDAVQHQPMAAAATALAVSLAGGTPRSRPPLFAQGLVAASVPSTIWACNKLALQIAWAKIQGDTQTIERLQDEWDYNTCDLAGWSETLEQYILYFQKNQGSIPYRKGGDYVLDYQLPAQATIALIGDWGTGTGVAKALLAQVARKKPDVVLHLGDIYYSGTEFESQARFLDICRQVLAADTALYTLAGNHDMYSGGAGYYGLVDQLGQQASYFCLRNANWQFLAMDTGYNDFNPFAVSSHVTALTDVEADWHRTKIQQAEGRKTVLLSHHQLFSAFEPIGGEAVNQNLLATFHDLLGNVALWFWGHEHRLDIYAPYQGLERGRCLGCSAIPVFVEADYFQPKFDVPLLPSPGDPTQIIRLGDDGTVYNRAYAIMKLDGASASVAYYQDSDENQPLFVEAI
jgi:predicted phosphodiesterase